MNETKIEDVPSRVDIRPLHRHDHGFDEQAMEAEKMAYERMWYPVLLLPDPPRDISKAKKPKTTRADARVVFSSFFSHGLLRFLRHPRDGFITLR